MLSLPSAVQGSSSTFSVGSLQNEMALDGLTSRLQAEEVALFDPMQGSNKRHPGFPLGAVLDCGFGADLRSDRCHFWFLHRHRRR